MMTPESRTTVMYVYSYGRKSLPGSVVCLFLTIRLPTRTGKPGKMRMHFPVRERSGNFEQTGKVRENHTKYWKTDGI